MLPNAQAVLKADSLKISQRQRHTSLRSSETSHPAWSLDSDTTVHTDSAFDADDIAKTSPLAKVSEIAKDFSALVGSITSYTEHTESLFSQ